MPMLPMPMMGGDNGYGGGMGMSDPRDPGGYNLPLVGGGAVNMRNVVTNTFLSCRPVLFFIPLFFMFSCQQFQPLSLFFMLSCLVPPLGR